MEKKEIKQATVKELAQRLLALKKEEQDIMLELWNRCPKANEEPPKEFTKELKPYEFK